MGLTKPPIEMGQQLLIRQDGSFIFRKLPIVDGYLVEYNSEQIPVNAWMMQYKLLKDFKGYKTIPAGKVTISHAGDTIFDPFNQLNDTEKPDRGEDLKKTWVTKVAESVCYRHEKTVRGGLTMDKYTTYMAVVMILLALGLGAKAVF